MKAEHAVEEHPVHKTTDRTHIVTSEHRPINLSDPETVSGMPDAHKKLAAEKTFLPCILLKVSHRSSSSGNRPWLHTAVTNKGSKHGSKDVGSFRRWFSFASTSDPEQRTFAVVEKGSQDEATFWGHDLSRRSSVGDRFCIMAPQLLGRLNESDVLLIETENAFDPISQPTVPPRVNMTFLRGERFFIFKKMHITVTDFCVIDTKCSGSFCDRSRGNVDGACGCHLLPTKVRGSANTIVFRFDVSFKATEDSREVTVRNFSSLKTTKLFHSNKQIPASSHVLCTHPTVAKMLETVVARFVNCVNSKSGFTLVGWGKRGVKSAGTGESSETTASTEINWHLSHLGPTKDSDWLSMPKNHKIEPTVLQCLAASVQGNVEQTGEATDAL